MAAVPNGSPDTTATTTHPSPAPTSPQKRKRSSPRPTKQQLLTILTSAKTAIQTFLSQNYPSLLPSQCLSLSSLLSSIPFPPHPSPPPFFLNYISSPLSSTFPLHWTLFFGMSQSSFSHLLSLLSPALSSLPPSIPPPVALAAALFRLSHAASFSTIARLFSLDSPTGACLAFYSVSRVIINQFGNLLEFRQDWECIVQGFGWISMPNCRGVLGLERFNGSVLVQALVDVQGRFLDISAGWPIGMSPLEVFSKSRLRLDLKESNEFLEGPFVDLGGGYSVPHYLLGESCFPLMPWLLTPYSENGVDGGWGSKEREFNFMHGMAMGLVRTAFRRVKSRWRLLGRRWKDDSTEFLPYVIVVGCLLHNFLIKCGEPVLEEVGEEAEEEEEGVLGLGGELDETGWRIRDAIAEHLCRVRMRRHDVVSS